MWRCNGSSIFLWLSNFKLFFGKSSLSSKIKTETTFNYHIFIKEVWICFLLSRSIICRDEIKKDTDYLLGGEHRSWNPLSKVQSAKILLLPPKYEIIMVPSNHSFFQYCNSNIGLFFIAPCKVITLNPLGIVFGISSFYCFFFDGFLSIVFALSRS